MQQKELNKSSKELSNIFSKSQLRILGIILAVKYFTKSEKDEALVAIGLELKSLSKRTDSWLDRNISKYYNMGNTEASGVIGASTIKTASSKAMLQGLKDSASTSINDAISGIHRSSSRILDKAMQAKLKARIAEGKVSGETLKQIADSVAGDLSKKGIYLIDSAGRKWDVVNYSELYSRTELMNTYNEGVSDQMLQHDVDLAYVTSYASCQCDICQEWEGKVLSLTGKTKGYPTLDDAYASGLFHPNCYSDDTEVYTDKGWKLFKDLHDERIMSINPNTQEMEWVNYVHLIKYYYKDKMYNFLSNSYDLLVTPNHNMYIGTNSHISGNKRIIKWKIESAKDMINTTHKHLRTVKWNGQVVKSPISTLNAKQFAFLLGTYLAEGYVDNRKVVIAQSEGRKQRFRQELLSMGFYENKDRFIKTDIEMSRYFSQFGKSWEKFVPAFFMNAKSDVLQEFLRAFNLGDGTKRTRTVNNITNSQDEVYFTSSERLAEQLGEMIFKAGKYPSFTKPALPKICHFKNGSYMQKHTCWIIRANRSKHSYYNISPSTRHRGIQLKEIDYARFVYDVELEKNHVLLVRRNGKTAWSGNCKHRLRPYLD